MAVPSLTPTTPTSVDGARRLSQELSDVTDSIEAEKVLRKIDWRIIPLLQFLYMLTFLDRVNIGNARLWNLESDLQMTGYDYNIIVLVFYVPYILLELPSNYFFNRVEPRKFIGVIIMGWGLSVTFAGFSTSFVGLLVARIFIGIFEAGMFPGCIYLISGWYRRHELLTRMAFFFVANDIAGTISGLLGAGLGSLDGVRGYSGWRWIFFIEGTATCLAATLAWLFVPPFPDRSTFLTPSEKQWLLKRLKADNKGMSHEKMTVKSVVDALKDWKILTSGVLYLAVCTTAYSISVFQPTILRTFGWGELKSNLLSAPPRLASGIVSVLLGIWSDKIQRRGVFCLGGFFLSILGLLLIAFLKGSLRYIGVYFAAIGIYIVQPLCIAWCANQVTSSNKRGTITAFAGTLGQLGGIISALVFPLKDGPQYLPGIMTCIAFQIAGIIAAINMWAICAYENRQREAGKRDYLRELPREERDKLGEKHPDFRYTL
ncbi:major facilitator superfamily domain-containing protein [Durotheca rogersii]|uniref:major facilitator superfamily domain-containing protein n=1 Tax=Durotheca rogersii TaxID=419775 RepID=UPI00221FD202|nr:major facilitator superfamily domain-containing protein [Durotheca rogersii]KAI5857497.1 major facilitator superfamily domain-containing protein [Durotheca rogersii]